MDIFKKLTLASIGAIELTREKMEEIFDEMVKKGEMTDDQRAAAVKSFVDKSSGEADKLKGKIEEIFAKCAEKCASKVTGELAALGKRTEDLAARVDKLEKKGRAK
jgi:polyhydroxyalkanoate synthesis regulator phasin